MKNLKELAKEFNLFQVSDIPQRYKGEDFDWRISRDSKKHPDYLDNCKLIEIGLFYECRQDTNIKGEITTYYIERSYTLLKSIDSDLILMLRTDRNGKFYFHPLYNITWKYEFIYYETRNKAINTIKEPNYIGVFTDKKIADWLNYCEEYIKVLEDLYSDIDSKNKAIELEIEDLIKKLNATRVQRSNGSKTEQTIWIYNQYFEVILTHSKQTGNLYNDIRFTGRLAEVINISKPNL